MHAAANLLRRATAVVPTEGGQRAELLPELGEALMGLGDFDGARDVLREARALAGRLGLARVKAASELIEMFRRLYSGDRGGGGEEALPAAPELIPVLERENAHNELATAWRMVLAIHGMAGRYRLAADAAERSIAHARLAGNDRLVSKVGGIFASNALMGTTPVREAIAQCEQLLADGLSDRQVECKVMCELAQLRAMNGELEVARALYRRGRALLLDLGQGVYAASTGIDLALTELHGGDLALAEREVRADLDFLARMGETYFLSTIAALLAHIVREQGRDEEALALLRTAEEAASEDDVDSQSLVRAIRAPILARAGELAQAEEVARAAVEMLRETEAPNLKADALFELASVLGIAGRTAEAKQAVEEAIALYAEKGNVANVARCSAWRDRLGATGPAPT
jgi:tetratricopeptide (TPR) repeat protein